MRLAEALNRRADLQRRMSQLKSRILNNVRVQEGDEPSEEPRDLFEELQDVADELQKLIVRINRTNEATTIDGKTLTELIAIKDMKKAFHSILSSALDEANNNNRYSRNEIRYVRTIEVGTLRAEADQIAMSIRQLDTKLQEANWSTELL